MHSSKRIYLTGYMGCGKSTAGRKLASAMGWAFADLDELIEAAAGKSIEEIFIQSGEKSFREYESRVLHDLNPAGNTVISVGGGAPCFFDNLSFMKITGMVIYLKMTPEKLRVRLMNDTKTRPLIRGFSGDELTEYIKIKLAEREYFYMQANLIVDGDDPDIGEIISRIKQ